MYLKHALFSSHAMIFQSVTQPIWTIGLQSKNSVLFGRLVPKQVINHKNTFSTNNRPNISTGLVAIAIGLICSKANTGLENSHI